MKIDNNSFIFQKIASNTTFDPIVPSLDISAVYGMATFEYSQSSSGISSITPDNKPSTSVNALPAIGQPVLNPYVSVPSQSGSFSASMQNNVTAMPNFGNATLKAAWLQSNSSSGQSQLNPAYGLTEMTDSRRHSSAQKPQADQLDNEA